MTNNTARLLLPTSTVLDNPLTISFFLRQFLHVTAGFLIDSLQFCMSVDGGDMA